MGGSIVQFGESVIVAAVPAGDGLSVRLAPAVVIRSEGVPGVDASTRWSQEADIALGAHSLEGALPAFPAALSGGRIAVNSMTYVDMLPVPLDSAGRIRLSLEFAGGAPPVVIHAESVTLTLHGHGRYVAHLPPA